MRFFHEICREDRKRDKAPTVVVLQLEYKMLLLMGRKEKKKTLYFMFQHFRF